MEISFSQSNQWQLCKRSWSFSKVQKLRGISSFASIRGSRYHEAIEDHVKAGTNSSNRSVTNALDIVAELTDVVAEQYLEGTVDDIKVRGYADVIGTDSDGNRVVVDWKFPGKSPGRTPKKDYVDQLQLYGYMSKAESVMVAFPEHDKAFKLNANHERGAEVFDRLVNVAKDIIDTDAFSKSGMETEPSPNFLCANYCNFRHLCPMGALNND